jgi:hypothetical protein
MAGKVGFMENACRKARRRARGHADVARRKASGVRSGFSRARERTGARARWCDGASGARRRHGWRGSRQTRDERVTQRPRRKGGAATTGAGVGSKARIILASVRPVGFVGESCCCLAVDTALQSSHRPSGLKARCAALAKESVSRLAANMRPKAYTCTKSHWLPVAKSQASRVRIRENRWRIAATLGKLRVSTSADFSPRRSLILRCGSQLPRHGGVMEDHDAATFSAWAAVCGRVSPPVDPRRGGSGRG